MGEGYAELLSSGIDTWAEAWNYQLAEEFYSRLNKAQKDARALDPVSGQAVTIRIGGEDLQVAPYGAKGAPYWCQNEYLQIAFGPPSMEWNVRVRYLAKGLWCVGLSPLRKRVYELMQSIGRPREGGELERVSRFDYAIDFHAPSFTGEMVPEIVRRFVAPGQSKWAVYGRGNEAETARVGKLPYLQLEVYNKGIEITEVSGKDWMRAIWGYAPHDPLTDIWRIEVRFGKAFLKDRNIRTVPDVYSNLAELVSGAIVDRRLTAGRESGRARRDDMHPLWYMAWQAAGGAREAPAVGRLATMRREKLRETIMASMAGTFRTLAVLNDGAYDGATVRALADEIIEGIEAHPFHEKNIDRAMERYADIVKPEGNR